MTDAAREFLDRLAAEETGFRRLLEYDHAGIGLLTALKAFELFVGESLDWSNNFDQWQVTSIGLEDMPAQLQLP